LEQLFLSDFYTHTQQVNTVIPLQLNNEQHSSSSSSLIASASNDSYVVIWNVSSKKKLRSLKDNSKCEITSLLQIDVNTLASSSFWNIKIWDLTTFNEKFNLIGHSRDVTTIINVNCSLIASSSLDGTIKIWDVDAKEEMFTIYGYKGVKCLADIGKNRFAFAGDDNSVLFYNGIFKQEICVIKTIQTTITSMSVYNNEYIIVSSITNEITLIDTNRYIITTKFTHNDNTNYNITCIMSLCKCSKLHLDDMLFGTDDNRLLTYKSIHNNNN
jgi:WD40 repeat protein